MRTEFLEQFPLDELKPADYNPRKLEDDKFILLQESLKKFGIIKPVIVNGDNGILTAGHQRTRAMKAIGMTHCPAIRIKGITRADEITFNLFHNSIETDSTPVLIDVEATAQRAGTYQFISHETVSYERNQNALIVKNMGDLITKYGEWGSIVCSEDGRVLLNSDYAVASHQNRCGMLCYMLPREQEEEMMRYLGYEYGQYFYDALGVKSYNQLHCQMKRLAGKKSRKIASTLYENYVIPELSKESKTIDFGAGRCAYVKLLASQGYDICAYEPHFQVAQKLNVQEVVKQINHATRKLKRDGLFDTVILDSVLNSVVDTDFEHAVLTTCNALLREGGTIYVGTRNLDFYDHLMNLKTYTGAARGIEFMDKNNFAAS
ncbi:MAG: ParB N-terminal domain-containing protein, partial [Akkermansia sp.]